jgi:hypothetical protein
VPSFVVVSLSLALPKIQKFPRLRHAATQSCFSSHQNPYASSPSRHLGPLDLDQISLFASTQLLGSTLHPKTAPKRMLSEAAHRETKWGLHAQNGHKRKKEKEKATFCAVRPCTALGSPAAQGPLASSSSAVARSALVSRSCYNPPYLARPRPHAHAVGHQN